MGRSAALLAVVLAALGCGGDDATVHEAGIPLDAAGATDGGATTDASAEAGLDRPPRPERFLDPSRYDCRARGQVDPPSTRPGGGACWRDTSCGERLVVADRLATAFAPENGLSGLRASILMGADLAIADVRATCDGSLVLMHDEDVCRTTVRDDGGNPCDGIPRPVYVAEHDASEIVSLRLRPEDGDPAGDFACEHVPTLDEAFAVARGKLALVLDVHDHDTGMGTPPACPGVPPTASAASQYLVDHRLLDDAVVLCDHEECDQVRAVSPDIAIAIEALGTETICGGVPTSEMVWQYSPRFVLVRASESSLVACVPRAAHAAGAMVLANVLDGADVSAQLLGDTSGYAGVYAAGADALRTLAPHLVLEELGRLSAPP